MFRYLTFAVTKANIGVAIDQTAAAVMSTYPLQLSRWLEECWAAGGLVDPAPTSPWSGLLSPTPVIAPGTIARLREPDALINSMLSGINPGNTSGFASGPFADANHLAVSPVWDHLIYAYLVEATGIVEIFSEVVRRYVVGESLPTPTGDTIGWVRATEELFFRDPPLFATSGALASRLRPDAAVNRRNAYWRMFGVDLPHPPPGAAVGQPWKRDAGNANVRFLELWNELLRQVWLGYENDSNTSGPNATDSSYVSYLCRTLGEMLRMRRQGGMLAREEFGAVSMLDWFHLTVSYDTPVINDLAANAGAQGNAADRLAAIGARVGISPSRQSRELFELADLVSPLMWFIELGLFDTGSQAELLYRHRNLATPNQVAVGMNRVVDLWQSATGQRVKDLAVTTRQATPARPAQPVTLLPAQRTAPNGRALAANGRPVGPRS